MIMHAVMRFKNDFRKLGKDARCFEIFEKG